MSSRQSETLSVDVDAENPPCLDGQVSGSVHAPTCSGSGSNDSSTPSPPIPQELSGSAFARLMQRKSVLSEAFKSVSDIEPNFKLPVNDVGGK